MSRTKWLFILILCLAAGVVASLIIHKHAIDRRKMDNQNSGGGLSLQLFSPVFRGDAAMPSQYTCKGQNVNPPLNIMGVPAAAKSLALIMHDPDAVNSDFTHWLVWDIPTSTETITANSVPVGAVQGANGAGQNKYLGPCPPAGTGTHRYMFELYALDKPLSLKPGASRDELQKAMAGHIVAKHSLTGLFSAQ